MPCDVVWVEVRGPAWLLDPIPARPARNASHDCGPELEGLLFGHLADRWSLQDASGSPSSMWFEIDRRSTALQSSL